MAPRQRLYVQSSGDEIPPMTVLDTRSDASEVHSKTEVPTTRTTLATTGYRNDTTTNKDQLTASDLAREQHDFFNLIALLAVVASTLSNWNFSKLAQGHGPGEAWTGDYFYVNWLTTVCYFIIDLIWVVLVPVCVKSPDTIVKHHMVAIAYLSGPIGWPKYRWFMGACLTVEVNTWFLILRRVVYKRQEQISPALTAVVSALFYVSWIVVRCFIYPGILLIFLQLAMEEVQTTNRLWHWPMVFIPVHFFLCILNLKWTYDLFQPMVKTWIDGSNERPAVSNGL